MIKFEVVYVLDGQRRSIECDSVEEARERTHAIAAAAAIKGQPDAPIQVMRTDGPSTVTFDNRGAHD